MGLEEYLEKMEFKTEKTYIVLLFVCFLNEIETAQSGALDFMQY